jgi:transaldolase
LGQLRELYDTCHQSPWLDNLSREWLRDGTLASWIERGIRGVTSNPTIFAKAIGESSAYDEDFAAMLAGHEEVTLSDIKEIYWELVCADVQEAARLFAGVYHSSGKEDGYVSIEVDPGLSYDTEAMVAQGVKLFETISEPNVLIKIPATRAGVVALAELTARGINVNATLIFSLKRYEEVAEAYQAGLRRYAREVSDDLTGLMGVASFFISRVDTALGERLKMAGLAELDGKVAIALATTVYGKFRRLFSTTEWVDLARKGALKQAVLWASTSTKDPSYPELASVEGLIAPQSINTMPEATAEAFSAHGRAVVAIYGDSAEANEVLTRVQRGGIDLEEVSEQLTSEGVGAFCDSFNAVIRTLSAKANQLVSVG